MKVWEAKLDGRYQCEVNRIDDYTGRYTITDEESGKVLYDNIVTLSYGAQFGPDVDDVCNWENIAMDIVDG